MKESLNIKLSPDVLTQEISGEMVILDLKKEQYLSLNEFGTRIWKMLEKTSVLDDIFQDLLDDFEVEATILERDMKQLLIDMDEAGLVTISKV